MQECIRKELLDCIQFTKENRDEFLKVMEPQLDGKKIFIADDDYVRCTIQVLGYGIHYYFYNSWYVLDWVEGTWCHYTDKQFHENFKLVE